MSSFKSGAFAKGIVRARSDQDDPTKGPPAEPTKSIGKKRRDTAAGGTFPKRRLSLIEAKEDLLVLTPKMLVRPQR